MMLEEQLMKFFFFNKTGGYSIRKNSRSAVESILYTSELLSDHQNMVLLFPQGKIETAYTSFLKFESGIGRIIHKTNNPIQIIFMVNLIDYFSDRKPGLFMYISEYKGDRTDTLSMQEAYNLFYNECVVANSLKSND